MVENFRNDDEITTYKTEFQPEKIKLLGRKVNEIPEDLVGRRIAFKIHGKIYEGTIEKITLWGDQPEEIISDKEAGTTFIIQWEKKAEGKYGEIPKNPCLTVVNAMREGITGKGLDPIIKEFSTRPKPPETLEKLIISLGRQLIIIDNVNLENRMPFLELLKKYMTEHYEKIKTDSDGNWLLFDELRASNSNMQIGQEDPNIYEKEWQRVKK